ncbi:MAG: alpha/beta fold hydrolase [Chloroflexi bacterium]|nr:alpha/beta fold hydrolase [Chloroflexota bacterium]
MGLGRWRLASIILAGLGGGALALLNRRLLLDDLPPTLPGAMHDWEWRGWRTRYTTLGNGPPIILLHGIHAAASSFEMRQVFEPLSHDRTVYALDWPGFGKSARPAASYTGSQYAALLADFLQEVVQRPGMVVASSLSAAYAVAVARQSPELLSGLVLLSPTFQTEIGPAGRAGGWLLRTPLLGTALFNGLVSRASIRGYMRRAYADPALADETVIGQQWATAHQPNARLAPAAFVAGALDLPAEIGLPQISTPILVIRGEVPGIGRQASDLELRRLGPRVHVETLPNVGQLPHDEAADAVLGLIRESTALAMSEL